MSYNDVQGNRLFYTDEGSGGETLLLVHGATCDSHDWAAQIAPFTAEHRVVAPDLRGHGRSGAVGGAYRPDVFVADLADLLDRVDAGPVVVVGHSLGALLGSMLAVQHPHLVRALVAVDPSYGFTTEFAAGVAAGFHGPDPVGLATTLLGALESPDPQAAPDWLGAWHRRRALGVSPEVIRDAFLGIFETGTDMTVRPAAEDYLARRTCPVLTVSAGASLTAKGIDGDWDRSVSPHPYSESVVLDGVGHWLFQERPAEFNSLVLGWIAGLSDHTSAAAGGRVSETA